MAQSRFISSKQLVLTIIDAGSKSIRCTPSRERTLDKAMLVILGLNTLLDKSIIAIALGIYEL